ncbi:MAG TPA: lysophospholipid acyltransferase family protein [Gemmataceae bacterium]|nr:lysophospholipid acyltransferase family protein [Gemmataceae bacterium]
MSKPRSVVTDYLVYQAVRCVVCLIQSLPYRTATKLASGLAWLIYHVDQRHRLVALDNLRHAFPDRWTEAQLDRQVRAVYRHFCTLLVDIIHLPRKLRPCTWRRHVELDQARWVDLLLSGRPLLLVTGHFGNWELGGYVLGLLGFTTHAIARPLDNPFLDDYLRGFRERTGQKILAKKGDFDQMQGLLASGGVLATLADQDAGQRGLFVDYFGRPASTHKAVALMALEFKTPLVVLGIPRLKGELRYRIEIADVIYPEEYEGRPDAVKAMTQRFTTGLEGLVRQAPAQYFWLHRRWKHQPQPKRPKKAA